MPDRLGDHGRQRLHLHMVGDLLEHAAVAHAGRVLGADQLDRDRRLDGLVEPDPDQVDVHQLAAHRMALCVLQHGRGPAPTVERHLEHRAGPRKRRAQRAGLDGEADRLAAAAVEHARHEALVAHAPRRARAVGLAARDVKSREGGAFHTAPDRSEPGRGAV